MKKHIIFTFLLALFFLVGCTDSIDQSDTIDETIITDGCKYVEDDSALVGLSGYDNIERKPFCEAYIEILTDMSTQNGYKNNTIIYHDEKELIFQNDNGLFYHYKDKVLVEHEGLPFSGNKQGILGFDYASSKL
ncbi:MAG: hypothetical protein Q7I99_05080, partial [Acholeplasmataceae bacterium]|nr:hypothetical protein [Acholeplasmataceae bacterium]